MPLAANSNARWSWLVSGLRVSLRFEGLTVSYRGQFDEKRRSAFLLVLASNLPAVLLNNSIASTQAQARSLSHGPRRVKRIEHAVRLQHPGPRIGELGADYISDGESGDGEGAAGIGHGMSRIVDDVRKDL